MSLFSFQSSLLIDTHLGSLFLVSWTSVSAGSMNMQPYLAMVKRLEQSVRSSLDRWVRVTLMGREWLEKVLLSMPCRHRLALSMYKHSVNMWWGTGTGLPGEAVRAPPREVFKARLDGVLSNPVCWEMALPVVGELAFKPHSNQNQSVICNSMILWNSIYFKEGWRMREDWVQDEMWKVKLVGKIWAIRSVWIKARTWWRIKRWKK